MFFFRWPWVRKRALSERTLTEPDLYGWRALVVEALCTSAKCAEALSAARKIISDPNSDAVHQLSSAASTLAATNHKDAARSVLGFVVSKLVGMDNSSRAGTLISVGQAWLKLGDQEQSKAAFSQAAEAAAMIPNQDLKSSTLSDAARGLAAVHEFRRARLKASSCTAVDQLKAYVAVLNAYSGHNN
jgi:hypothetical protein